MDFGTLQLLHRCHQEYSRRKLREQSLSDTEYQLCAYIDIHGGCSQEQAATALRMDKTTVAKALTALERKGWIARAADPIDRRRKQLRLTEEGSGKLSGLTELHSRWLDEIMAVLSPEEQLQFEDSCERLLRAAETLAEKKESEEEGKANGSPGSAAVPLCTSRDSKTRGACGGHRDRRIHF